MTIRLRLNMAVARTGGGDSSTLYAVLAHRTLHVRAHMDMVTRRAYLEGSGLSDIEADSDRLMRSQE